MKEIAKRGRDALSGPLRLGAKYTIGPYRLPDLVRQVIEHVPQMPLLLQENFSAKLPQMLRTGELDRAIMAEPFPAAVPRRHPLARRKSISTDGLKSETCCGPAPATAFARRRFARHEAIAALRNAICACPLAGARRLS